MPSNGTERSRYFAGTSEFIAPPCSALSRYCEGIIEAAWLAALIVVPVFFDIYSSRIFEPDKITLLRTLALVILAAWITRVFDQGGLRGVRLGSIRSTWQSLRRIPLALPVLALVAVYLLSTIFSVTPRVSLWGSYQRLQGTYSMLSYLVVFAALAVHLRRREQVERLITVVVLASLPVSLYGVLQRFGLDPIPWGGDVTNRIAANMGNSIFVGAYFIMAFPLTLMRIVESFEALMAVGAPGEASRAPGEANRAPGDASHRSADFIRATAYVFIAALQVIALYFTGSRGPWLGWAASLVFMWLGLSLIWRARWMTISGVALALAAATFLILLNIPNGPLQSLRTRPEFGRLGQLLDAESRTGRVRSLIWQGAADLVSPHPPLEFPDGSKDAFNFLRPLIGYGPESMYVAYNSFYPPELTQVEKRNASPDRSHNETWDALVITGILGLVANLAIFGSVLYYALKWLGLVPGDRQRRLYLGLFLAGGLLSSLVFVLWKGLPFLGVALPFGMMLGVIVYMLLVSLSSGFTTPQMAEQALEEKRRAYILLGLLAAIMAHFVEVHFGIAVASTRTYFWAFTALLFVLGYVAPAQGAGILLAEAAPAVDAPVQPVSPPPAASRQERRKGKKSPQQTSQVRKRRRSAQSAGIAVPDWLRLALVDGGLLAVLTSTLGYLYITNSSRLPTAMGIVKASLIRLNPSASAGGQSGLLVLVLTTWLVGALLLNAQSIRLLAQDQEAGWQTWVRMLAVTLGLSLAATWIFWVWHAGSLVALASSSANSLNEVMAQVQDSESILTRYYLYLFLLIFASAVALSVDKLAESTPFRPLSLVVGVGAMLFAFILAAITNLRVVQADIDFKTADAFARPGSWPVSISIYNRARELAPNEDYYYLFLGRAYLEYAKTLTDTAERDRLIEQAARDLRAAQKINPLNTDHTANLARLYNLWASTTSDAVIRDERARTSQQYFERALVLSPNNARLWDEWALLDMNVLGDPEQALDHLQRALELDPYYDWTYALLGDYYSRYLSAAPDITPEQKQSALERAAENYSKALEYAESQSSSLAYNYALALGSVHTQLNRLGPAVQAYQLALTIQPDAAEKWQVEEVLARLYVQLGDPVTALAYARQALVDAPDDQRARLQALVTELGG
ncbi:MAG: hypothetical protein AB1894_19215 [Chloroflexota bacterium]